MADAVHPAEVPPDSEIPSEAALLWEERSGAWLALLACVVTLALVAGARLSFSAFFRAVEEDTGLDRLTLSVAVAISYVAYGAALPFAGRLATRYGGRSVLMAGVLLMAIGGVGVSAGREAWQFYLFVGVVPGIGFAAAGFVPGAVLLARWFRTRLGLAAGVAVASIPAGQALFVPVAAALIPRLGWRATYIATGAVLAAVALPLLWWWGREPPGGTRVSAHPVPRSGFRSDADIRLLAAGYVACGFSDQFVAFLMVALVSDAGVAAVKAAAFLSFALVAGVIGSVISGPLADRWRPPLILAAMYLARAMVLPLLLLVAPTRDWNLAIFVLVFGLTYISNQAPSTRLVRDRYGLHAVGPLMGNFGLAHQFGAAAGIAVGGLSVRLTGGYATAIVLTAAIALAGGVLQLMIRDRGASAGGDCGPAA